MPFIRSENSLVELCMPDYSGEANHLASCNLDNQRVSSHESCGYPVGDHCYLRPASASAGETNREELGFACLGRSLCLCRASCICRALSGLGACV
eukprot:3324127-Pleurochrysis_carterae.AAC.2